MNVVDKMLQFYNSKQAENMMCVEFDLNQFEFQNIKESNDGQEAAPTSIFSRANQEFTNSNFFIKLNGVCHSHSIFEKHQQQLGIQLNGKKVIKSIQDRILKLKKLLKEEVQINYPNIKAPEHLLLNAEKTNKFYLN